MVKLKQSRWVKIHEPGDANINEKDNIMNIMVEDNHCQAEATFTVRSYRKATYWLLKYLEAADALQSIAKASEIIQKKTADISKNDDKLEVCGDNWTGEIKKMSQGVFKVRMTWEVSEPVTSSKTVKQSRSPRKKTVKTTA